MPIDCEYLLSVSPPIFTTRSFRNFSACDPFGAFGKPFAQNGKNRLNYSDLNFYNNGRNKLDHLIPLRSCLIVKSTGLEALNNRESNKKKVVFADDKGFALTSVKLVCEPSDCPPPWDDSFLEQVTQGITAEASPKINIWEPDFVQPAANYLQFRNKLESKCVSLENVIVKDDDKGCQYLSGTVKVKNIEFHKEVNVRVSFNLWTSHQDFLCKFVPSTVDPEIIPINRHDLYDTFSFSIPLPESFQLDSNRKIVEFCVHYSSGDLVNGPIREFWDNNDGKNYRLIAAGSTNKSKDSTTEIQFEDALTAEFTSWTNFASWQHLINDNPYW